MTKAEATKAIKVKMHKEHSGLKKLTVKWVEWGKAQYPTGKTGIYGYCAIHATGYQIRGFLFQVDSDGYWRMFQSAKAMNKIAKML